MNKKYKIGFNGGMFDLIVKSRDYRSLEERYQDEKSITWIRKKHLKDNIIPMLNDLIFDIIDNDYSIGVSLARLNFNYSKESSDCFIFIEFIADDETFTANYMINVFNDIKVKLMDALIKKTNVVAFIQDDYGI